jgi:hypothetical protein
VDEDRALGRAGPGEGEENVELLSEAGALEVKAIPALGFSTAEG